MTEPLGATIAVALSQNVAAALEPLTWRRLSVAHAPTADALLSTLIASRSDALRQDGAELAG